MEGQQKKIQISEFGLRAVLHRQFKKNLYLAKSQPPKLYTVSVLLRQVNFPNGFLSLLYFCLLMFIFSIHLFVLKRVAFEVQLLDHPQIPHLLH